MSQTVTRWLIFAAIAVTSVACGPFVDPASIQNRADVAAGPVGGDTTVGEQFASKCDGLTSVEIMVASYPDLTERAGKLRLSLEEVAESNVRPIAMTYFDEKSLSPNEWIRLDFPPILNSKSHSYRLTASATSSRPAPFTLWASNHLEAAGVLRLENGESRPGALTMRVYCETTAVGVFDATIASILREKWVWPAALALCLLPGLGVVLLGLQDERDLAAVLGYAAGWSVLVAPLALWVASPLGSGNYAGPILLAGGVIAIATRVIRQKSSSPAASVALQSPSEGSSLRLTGTALVAIVGALGAAIVRTAIARDLVLPLWVDSVQHSYIAQLILDARGVPASYGISMPTEPFDYHFGFHALAAYTAGMAGRPVAPSVLAVGQVLGFLIPLATYALARDLTNSPRAAALAALAVGVVTTQPTYYVTWGRYTELAGLVALPAGFRAVRGVLEKRPTIGEFVLATAAGAAMPLVHPRVAIFLAALVVAYVVARLRPRSWETARDAFRLGCVAIAAALIIAPWILRQWGAHRTQLGLPATFQPIEFPFGYATAGNDRFLLGAALVGLAIAAIGRPRLLILAAVWGGLVLLAANPQTFGLPVFLWLNNDSLAIALFLPAAIYAGYAVSSVGDAVRFDRWPAARRSTLGTFIVVAAFTQAPSLLSLVNPCCYLAKESDLRAMKWVEEHTAPDARFVINGYRWSGNAWAGNDAGYWLPVLARRATTLPPLFYNAGLPTDALAIDEVAAKIEKIGSNPPSLAAAARANHADYVYVGTGGGPIDPFALANDPEFRVVYREDGAWVFEVLPGPGGSARTTVTDMTPVDVGIPSDVKAAGLRSTTSG